MQIKKLFAVIAASLLLASCGSSKQDFPGTEKIEALRTAAEGYDSGCYVLKNVLTDEIEQTFTFMFDTDDTEIYYCEGISADGYYAEYSNGRDLFREQGGKSVFVPTSDESYVSYTRKKPHPYSSGQLFFYINAYISQGSQTQDAEGNTLYVYTYDTEKMNKRLKTNLSEFATSYAFDANGNFVYFRQTNTDESGSYTYEITTENVNSITSIENPIKTGSDDS